MTQLHKGSRPLAAALAALALLSMQSAWAETVDVAAGRHLALRACGQCHATEALGESPVPDAPPFRLLGKTFDVESLPSRFKDGLMTSHSRMPMVRLDADEVAQLTAYLKTVVPPSRPGSPARNG